MPLLDDPEIYRTILEHLHSAVCVVDLQKRILFWNEGAERITGYSRIEVLGHSYLANALRHCPPATCESCTATCPLTAALRDGKASQESGLIHHKAGDRIAVNVWTTAVRDSRGLIVGVVQNFALRQNAMDDDPAEASMQAHGCLDSVTGFANHLMMESHLRETLGSFNELLVPFSILYLHARDLTLFRSKYGHDAANGILRVLAQSLKTRCGPLTLWDAGVKNSSSSFCTVARRRQRNL